MCTGKACCAAAEAVEVMKTSSVDIGHCKVGHVNLVRGPRGGPLLAIFRGHQGAAEDGELVAKVATIDGIQVSGVIPPLSLKTGMSAVVVWENKLLWPRRARETADRLYLRDQLRAYFRFIAAHK